ncbi:MAG: GNAT family N-acetyltransferase [Acidimicrobiia bacterium]|nr:GNAT family N-acetyltransferase [Acidimicrobiia bacterium]
MTVSTASWTACVHPDPGVVAAWERLADEVRAEPFVRPGWIVAWSEAWRSTLRLAVVRRDHRLLAVVPIVGRGGRVATPTGWHTPWHAAAAVDDEARRTAWDLVLGADAVAADHLLADGADAAVVRSILERRGHTVGIRDRQRPPFVELGGGWDAYEAAMTSKRRSDLRRRMRRLAETGEVDLDVRDGQGEDLDALLDEGFAVEASGWKGRAGTAVRTEPAADAFYRSVARWAADRGWLRLAYLRVDGRAVAFDFSLETDTRHYLLKTGFDETLRSHAPGALLRREMIRRSFDAGLETYEFTGDTAPWKQEWATGERQTVLIEGYAPTVGGRLRWGIDRGRRAARGALRRVRGR